MSFKKCPRCARAIVASAPVCQYCGELIAAEPPALSPEDLPPQELFEPPAPTPDDLRPAGSPAALESFPSFDLLFDRTAPETAAADVPAAPASTSASPASASTDFRVASTDVTSAPSVPARPLSSLLTPAVPSAFASRVPGSGAPVPAAPPAPFTSAARPPAVEPPASDEFDPLGDYDTTLSNEYAAAPAGERAEREHPSQPATTSATAASPATVPAVAAKRGMGSREVVMGLVGVGVAAGLIVALLGVRGPASSAAPKPSAAAAPAQVATPKPRKAPAAVAAPLAAATPKWSSTNSAEWIGRQRNSVAFELPASNKIQVWMRQVEPTLIVRCQAKKPEVFVFTNSAARMEPEDQDHTVRIRIDDGPERVERWPDSDSHDALFAPDGAALARELLHARTLHFSFNPHNAAPASARFDVAGLAEVLAPLAKRCGPLAAQP